MLTCVRDRLTTSGWWFKDWRNEREIEVWKEEEVEVGKVIAKSKRTVSLYVWKEGEVEEEKGITVNKECVIWVNRIKDEKAWYDLLVLGRSLVGGCVCVCQCEYGCFVCKMCATWLFDSLNNNCLCSILFRESNIITPKLKQRRKGDLFSKPYFSRTLLCTPGTAFYDRCQLQALLIWNWQENLSKRSFLLFRKELLSLLR